MTTRADKLLEGFKLGDLGAGKRTLVSAPQKEKVKILYDGHVLSSDGRKNLPTLYWEDSDGWKYGMVVRSFGKKARVALYGGPSLEMDKTTQSFSTGNFAWQLVSRFTAIDPDDLIHQFRDMARVLKVQGISSIVPLIQDFTPSSGMSDFFNWLKARRESGFIVEGFKLGDLGAGKPKLADQKNKFRIIDEIPLAADNPYLKWEDFDGFIYTLIVGLTSVKFMTYQVKLYRAAPASPGSNKMKMSNDYFELASSNITLKQAKHLYKQYLERVKSGGIKRLVAGGIKFLHVLQAAEGTYEKWLADVKALI